MKKRISIDSSHEIGLKLKDYEDIFSDLDLRPYKIKSLSDDFLSYLKRASLDKKGAVELKIFVPSDKRNNNESIIKQRLSNHFNKHFDLLNIENKEIIRHGFLFILVGILIMFIATFILFYFEEKTLLVSFLVILLEPAGWFLFWEGLNLIVFKPKNIKSELDFYRKMSNCRITFMSY